MALAKASITPPEVTNGFRDPAFTHNRQFQLHRWVPWVAGFSAEFVQDCLKKYLGDADPAKTWVLDPFAGVGTTLVEAYMQGRNVVGFEINPYAALAARAKLDAWRIDEAALDDQITKFVAYMVQHSSNGAAPASRPPDGFAGRTELFSSKVERKVLFALDYIGSIEQRNIRNLFRVAFGSVMVSFSNYTYEPSLTRRASVGKSLIDDFDVADTIARKLTLMREDIAWLKQQLKGKTKSESQIIAESVFDAADHIERARFVDLAVTSPPYLNNYHYPRNTRPQVHWLGIATGKGYEGARESESFGKFWQTVRNLPEVKLKFQLPALQEVIDAIRAANTGKEEYGGPGWANYAATYFNDTHKFCRVLKRLLKPNGVAVIVLGNSVIQGIEMKTDDFFGKIAELHGLAYEDNHMLRKKRTGSSIIQSSVRVDKAAEKVALYESAIVLRKAK